MPSAVPFPVAQMESPSHYRRKRTASLFSVSSNSSRISFQPPLLEKTVPARTSSHLVYGSFGPTASAEESLSHIRRLSLGGKGLNVFSSSSSARHERPWHDEDADSPLSSGLPSPVIPSIMRTSSSSTLEEGLPSPLLPSTAYIHHNLVAPSSKGKAREEMNPILARLERKSKLLCQKAQCATCGKMGADFPRCGRCSMMWCSRECRMSRGKRHVCNPSK